MIPTGVAHSSMLTRPEIEQSRSPERKRSHRHEIDVLDPMGPVPALCLAFLAGGARDARAGIIFQIGNNPQPDEQNILLNTGDTGTTVFGVTNRPAPRWPSRPPRTSSPCLQRPGADRGPGRAAQQRHDHRAGQQLHRLHPQPVQRQRHGDPDGDRQRARRRHPGIHLQLRSWATARTSPRSSPPGERRSRA